LILAFFQLILVGSDVLESQYSEGGMPAILSRIFSGPPAENVKLQHGIPHKPVPAVNAARGLADNIKTKDVGFAPVVDLDAAVLVMERWLYQHRVFGDIDVAADELADPAGKFLARKALPWMISCHNEMFRLLFLQLRDITDSLIVSLPQYQGMKTTKR
jgi:hypothetical protein